MNKVVYADETKGSCLRVGVPISFWSEEEEANEMEVARGEQDKPVRNKGV